MIDSIVKVVRGILKLRGATDNTLIGNVSDSLKVNQTNSIPAGSNTVGAVTQASGPWTQNVTQFGSSAVVTGTGASGSGIPRVTVANDSNVLATQSGTWNVNNVSGTVSLPTGASTAANQTNASQKTQVVDGSGNVIGATSNALNVNVVNSFAAGTPDKTTFTYGTTIENSVGGVYQDTSPTLTAGQQGAVRLTQNRAFHENLRDSAGNELLSQKTMANSIPIAIASDQTAIPATQSGTWNINNVSGTVSLPTGASTSALQTSGNTSLSTIVTNTTHLAQGSTTSGQTGDLQLAATTTAAPTYTTGQTNPLSLTTAGALRTDSSGTTQPISGSVTVTQATGTNLHAVIDSGTIAATQSGTWNINNVSGTISLPTGAATETTLVKLPLAQGSTTSGQSGILEQGAVTTAAPVYTNGQTSPLSLTLAGSLRTDSSSTQQPVVGTGSNGSPNGGVLSVQGVSGGFALPVSQGTAANLQATARLNDGSGNSISSTSNSLNVNVTNSFPVGIADKTTFTYGTSLEDTVGGVFQDTAPTLTAGQQGAIRLTSFRGVHTNLRDNSGTEVGTTANPIKTSSTAMSSTGSAPTTVTIGASSATVIASNASRKGLVITNTSTLGVLYLNFAAGTAVVGSGVTLYAHDSFYMDTFSFTTAQINGIASLAGTTVSIQEFT